MLTQATRAIHRSAINRYRITLILLFYATPFVDALTGLMINYNIIEIGSAGSPSQLLRFFITIVLFFQIRKLNHFFMVLLMILWVVVIESFSLILHTRLDWYIVGLVYSFKLTFGLILYVVLKEYIDCQKLDINQLQRYIVISSVIYSSFVLVSNLLGISAHSYGEAELGSKGIFADGNGLGVFLGVCLLVIVNKYNQDKKFRDLLAFFLVGYVLIGLMTKAGILFLTSGIILLFLTQKSVYKVWIIISISLLFLIWAPSIISFVTDSLSYIIWRIERSDYWWEIVLGGREMYLQKAMAYDYSSNVQILKLITGGGYRLSFRHPSCAALLDDGIFIVEADFFDVFFMYGVVGFLAYVIIFLKGVTSYGGLDILKCAWVLLFIHSALAGHVMSNGLALIILPCLLLMMEYREKGKRHFNLRVTRVH